MNGFPVLSAIPEAEMHLFHSSLFMKLSIVKIKEGEEEEREYFSFFR
jgi:hypothetical protein